VLEKTEDRGKGNPHSELMPNVSNRRKSSEKMNKKKEKYRGPNEPARYQRGKLKDVLHKKTESCASHFKKERLRSQKDGK
jgi:hypothetical protein